MATMHADLDVCSSAHLAAERRMQRALRAINGRGER
jgi:hypothetical protein